MTNSPNQKTKIFGFSISALGFLALAIALPATMFNFKPVNRFESKDNVLADSSTGEMYSWVDFGGGQVRFVKLDRKSEEEVRKGLKPQQALQQPDKSTSSVDVRSGRIFEKQGTLEVGGSKYLVDTKIKYRDREGSMLYRVAISAVPPIDKSESKPQKCITKEQSAALQSIYSSDGSSLSIRFDDSDRFWVKDLSVPLFAKQADNKVTTIIDGGTDQCKNVTQIVFHGRADLSLPDFSWVDNGKLMLSSVKINPGATPKSK